jgi:type VI secretion system protein VasJ
VAQGRAAVARSLLEELDERIERQGLSQWEPELCVEVWSQLQRVYQTLMQSASETSKEDYQNRIDRVFDRICRLDVRLALSEGGRA